MPCDAVPAVPPSLEYCAEGCAVQSVTVGGLTASVVRHESLASGLHFTDAAGHAVDLTGLLTWPGTLAMCAYITANPLMWAGKRVLELGSGAGLVGMFLGQLAALAVLTDNNPDVLKLLDLNVHNSGRQRNALGGGSLQCLHLEWGDPASMAACPLCPHGADFIVGSDLVYPDTARHVSALLATVDALLSRTAGSAFILSYVPRTKAVTRELFRQAEAAHLRLTAVPGAQYEAGPLSHGAVVLWFARQDAGAPPALPKALMEQAALMFPRLWEDDAAAAAEEYAAPFAGEEAGGDLW